MHDSPVISEDADAMDRYMLEFEPDPRLLLTARLFAASVARRWDVHEDAVLDTKIAISEACTAAIDAHRRDGLDAPVRVTAAHDEGGISYEVAGQTGDISSGALPADVFRRAAEDSGASSEMSGALIRSLFPQAEFGAPDDGTRVRFRVPTA